VRDQLEGLVTQMVDRGIMFDEAVGEFEKRFIKSVLDRAEGNQCARRRFWESIGIRSAARLGSISWPTGEGRGGSAKSIIRQLSGVSQLIQDLK